MRVVHDQWGGELDPAALERASGAIDLDAAQASCPACGESFETAAARCPSCGLRFG